VSWTWLRKDVVLAIHDVQIAEHGGISGVRDMGLLESALARPENLAAYGDPDASALAAAYAFGIARNHPFGDGNKRTAFVSAELFLNLNGIVLSASDSDCVLTILKLAAGDILEDELAGWIRGNVRPK
jgi:death on curing protein